MCPRNEGSDAGPDQVLGLIRCPYSKKYSFVQQDSIRKWQKLIFRAASYTERRRAFRFPFKTGVEPVEHAVSSCLEMTLRFFDLNREGLEHLGRDPDDRVDRSRQLFQF